MAIRKEQISTGAALGKIGEDRALKSGLMETLERDSVMLAWHSKKVRKIIDLPKKIEGIIDYFKRYQLYPYILDVTTELGIPSILTLTLDYSGIGDAVNVGSKSDLNYESAIEGALFESIQCRRSSRLVEEKSKRQENQVNSLEDRFIYWMPKERIKDVRHLIENVEQLKFSDLKQQNISNLEDAVRMLSNKGCSIFVSDITLPQIKEKGFEVLKVMIPELLPLYLDENAKALYSKIHGEIKGDKYLKPHPII